MTHTNEPSRWQVKVKNAVVICATGLIGVFVAMGIAHTRAPMRSTLPLLLCLMVCPTIVWWLWVDKRLAANPLSAASQARTKVSRILLAAYVFAVIAPLALLVAGWRIYDRLPVPIIMWLLAWHLSMAIAGMLAYAFYMAHLVRVGVDRARGKVQPPTECPPQTTEEAMQSRRAFLTAAITTAPVLIAGTTTAGGLCQQGRFIVRKVNVQLPRLPERLRGLTITQVSDCHVGRLFRPDHLPAVVEAVNRLASDLIVITGDSVDHDADFLEPACDAFAQMNGRYGRFMVIGNHDLIDSPAYARQYFRQREPNFLEDACRRIDIGGEQLQIVGLDWSRHERGTLDLPGHREHVQFAMAGARRDVFTLALAHHPHAFDPLADAGVDLTLAGHTHGGQLMLTSPGSAQPLGAGNLLFRYIWGEYRRNDATLFVTSGAGNWFPVRINAPAEIVQLRLV